MNRAIGTAPRRTVATLLTLLLIGPAAACGPRLAVGADLGLEEIHVGGETARSLAVVVGVRAGEPVSGTGVLFSGDIQPIPVKNPLRDESASSVFILPSLQGTWGSFMLRGGIGTAIQVWSGVRPPNVFTVAFASGGAVGLAIPPGEARGWSAEIFGKGGSGARPRSTWSASRCSASGGGSPRPRPLPLPV